MKSAIWAFAAVLCWTAEAAAERPAYASPALAFVGAIQRICQPIVLAGAAQARTKIEEAGYAIDESRIGWAVAPHVASRIPKMPASFGEVFVADINGSRIWGFASAHACGVRVNGEARAFDMTLGALQRESPVWAAAIQGLRRSALRERDIEFEISIDKRRYVFSLAEFVGPAPGTEERTVFTAARLERAD